MCYKKESSGSYGPELSCLAYLFLVVSVKQVVDLRWSDFLFVFRIWIDHEGLPCGEAEEISTTHFEELNILLYNPIIKYPVDRSK